LQASPDSVARKDERMQANGAKLQFDRALWAQWQNVHAWSEAGHVMVEPINDRASVTVFDSWGQVLVRYAFLKGRWVHADTGADPEAFDESTAGRVTPPHEILPSPALAAAAEVYRSRRPIRTPVIPGDEKMPREDSPIVQKLIRGAIAIFFAGWLVVWASWVSYVVWKVYTRIKTGEWPKLTLHDVWFHYHVGWLPAQSAIDYVLHTGLGWTFLFVGTAVYILVGGTMLFFLFMFIKVAETFIRFLYTTATAGSR
jgi:hypothetical protein